MSKWAPVILAPEPGEPSVKDDGTIERALDQVLLRPIIALLAANEKASTLAHLQAVLQNPGVPLENLDSFQPSEGPAMAGNICGHVFKSGEPTYSCRECAVDGTCVLCYKCFEKSAHRKHKYRMHTSSGGTGYCDCGDAEAWKAHVHCELHAQNAPAPSSADSVSTETAATAFDDVTLKRLKSIISQLLNYSLACLLTDLTEDLPADLNLEPCQECEGQFFCILYNDETHTYDGVIRALKSAVGCSEERAMLLATVVDREGRSLVKNDTKTACNSVRQEIERKTARDSNERTGRRGPLLAKVMKAELVAHQTTAIRLHQVLAQAAALHGSMQKVLAECLLEKPELTMEPVAKMLRYDHSLWKAARSANNQIILSALLIAPQTKAHFARIFTEDWNHARDNKHLATQCATPQHYAACVRHFVLDDDHEHNASALALSVQIYTVPSIAKQLVASPMSALQTILKVLNDITHVFVSTETGKFDFSQRTYPARLRRAVYAMTDLK